MIPLHLQFNYFYFLFFPRCEPLVPNRTSDPLAGFDKLPAENCGHIAKPD